MGEIRPFGMVCFGPKTEKISKHHFERFANGRKESGRGSTFVPLPVLKDAKGGKLVSPLDSWPSMAAFCDTFVLTIEMENSGKQEQKWEGTK